MPSTLRENLKRALKRPLAFSGRSSRGEFWAFAPLSVGLPLFAATVSLQLELGFWLVLLLTAAAALPLFAAGWRRVQDTGTYGSDAIEPWKFFFLALVLGYFTKSIFLWADTQISAGADGPTGFGVMIAAALAGIPMAIGAATAAFAFLFTFPQAAALTLLPSDTGTNKYGPNPHEAPQ
ncbi:hypothetical protein RA19_04145 [Leisingera sp. ANG-M1]|uniref:DUF805 domain-containing protein n=1 Tax=Leisingera sp. ANG-M1 TaxID=1577895 RepID=UPI00057E57AF|nr:DUF805 domain-containing protein [Leisingera sp. ANG-M1]KIC11836.1 hypothetical protein RA19_04145 [Leisingera sp. ANG-M1]